MAWFDTLDDDLKAHVTAKGFDKLEPDAAAAAAVKAHAAAEKMIGVPADQIWKKPKDASDPNFQSIYDAVTGLAAPKGADEYKFDGIKFADGTEPDEGFVTTMRSIAHELKLPIAATGKLAQAVVAYADRETAAEAEKARVAAAAEAKELDVAWGQNKEHYTTLAKRAVATLGFPADVIQKIEGAAGYARTMEAFKQLGERMQEPSWLTGNQGGGQKTYSREEALAEINALKGDTAWIKRWMDGGKDERAHFENLHKIAAGAPPQR